MAFKMTPGIKGNPAQSRIAGLGGCGGPGQPPCEPRFQKEVEEKRMRAADRTSSSRSKVIRAKKKVVAAPTPKPVKLKLNERMLEGFEMSKKVKQEFKMLFGDLSGFKNQEALDDAVMRFVKRNSGPILNPGPKLPPGEEGPIAGPIKLPPREGGLEEGFMEAPVKAPAAVKQKAAAKAK